MNSEKNTTELLERENKKPEPPIHDALIILVGTQSEMIAQLKAVVEWLQGATENDMAGSKYFDQTSLHIKK